MGVRLSQCAGCHRGSQALASYCGVGYCAGCLANQAQRLLKENERLKEPLYKLSTDSRTFQDLYGDGSPLHLDTFFQMQAIARDALAKAHVEEEAPDA